MANGGSDWLTYPSPQPHPGVPMPWRLRIALVVGPPLLVWLGLSWYLAHNRNEIRRYIDMRRGFCHPSPGGFRWNPFDEGPCEQIFLPPDHFEDSEVGRVAKWFPEAQIIR